MGLHVTLWRCHYNTPFHHYPLLNKENQYYLGDYFYIKNTVNSVAKLSIAVLFVVVFCFFPVVLLLYN